MNTAILLIIFNRLETTKKVFDSIKKAQPKRLYIASDGPRKNRDKEDKIVKEVQSWVLNHIDWPCQVKKHFNSENKGCGKNVSEAITWFFSNESEGIILEDDCVPHPDFFTYCEELLDKYRNHKEIWQISGTNPIGISKMEESYFFSKYMHCWGWATWADRWQHYTFNLTDYDEKKLKNLSSNKEVQNYFKNILISMQQNQIDTWDYQWFLDIVCHNGLCIMPAKNLISNIGLVGAHFSENSGNTAFCRPVYPCLPLIHPKKVSFNRRLHGQVLNYCLPLENKNLKILRKIIRCGCALIPVKSWRRKLRTQALETSILSKKIFKK